MVTVSSRLPTVAKSHSYISTKILFENTEITRFLKFEITKIGMETSKILLISVASHVKDTTHSF